MIDNTQPLPAPPPLERWISPAAQLRFEAMTAAAPAPTGDVRLQREHYDTINSARLAEALRLHPVSVEQRDLGGVPVHQVLPRDPVGGTLVCLHGGAFLWGAGAGAILEAVPVAAATGMRVIAVEYRLAPEHPFPAAVDDVLAVVEALRREEPGPVGIYGCSAGAFLTTQAVARMRAEGIAAPDAIALLHGSGVDVGGDSLATAALLNGSPGAADIRCMHDLPYFVGTDPSDPLVFPGEHPAVLADFPPTLLVTGTRDFAASSVAVMQRRLAAAGVDARLVVFDGMWHAHHVDVALPESEEIYAIMADFFRRGMGAS